MTMTMTLAENLTRQLAWRVVEVKPGALQYLYWRRFFGRARDDTWRARERTGLTLGRCKVGIRSNAKIAVLTVTTAYDGIICWHSDCLHIYYIHL
jgi:hypothetical protein